MRGVCKSRGVGLYTKGDAIIVSFNIRQMWNFKYEMLGGRTVVKVSRGNVRLYLNEEEFEEDWRIVEKAEG